MENPDSALAVEFINKPVQNNAKSKEAGRAIFDDCEFVVIRFPGDRLRVHTAPATEMHFVSHMGEQMTYAERFSAQYKYFKEHGTSVQSGTPLSEVGFLTAAQKAELSALSIHTVEQLAGLASKAQKSVGIHAMKMVADAKEFLDNATSNSEVEALKARIAELEAGAKPKRAKKSKAADDFKEYTDDDLRAILNDAGQEPGKDRAAMLAQLDDLTKESA